MTVAERARVEDLAAEVAALREMVTDIRNIAAACYEAGFRAAGGGGSARGSMPSALRTPLCLVPDSPAGAS